MNQNQNMNLVLSTDAKPRLKWTTELHQRFVDAVNQLGGADKSTPKSLMRIMGITGLTLYHLKSHLQKYRLGKSQQHSETNDQIKIEVQDLKESQRKDGHLNNDNSDGNESQLNEKLKISEALQLQLEVQKKLHEQIEVQRHLQLRIEAQGKYLQSVLRKAQETITEYSCSSVGLDQAKAELSQLLSMVNSGCQSSSISELTESGTLHIKDVERKEVKRAMCSMESSLTSSESSRREEEEENGKTLEIETRVGKRRSGRIRFNIDGDFVDFLSNKRSRTERDQESFEILNTYEMIDLNSKEAFELESKEIESQLIEYL